MGSVSYTHLDVYKRQKFMCGFAERNDLFELCSECMVSDDYIEIVHLFGSRVANEAELFKKQMCIRDRRNPVPRPNNPYAKVL